jgi:flotillin
MYTLIGGGTAILLVIGWIWASLFQKCGPNEAMLISGANAGQDGRKFTIVVGGGRMVMPVIQQRAFLSLEIMTIEIRTSAPIITRNGVPLFVEGVAQVKVQGDDVSIATAAEQFLGKSDEQISIIAHETLVGHLRAILGTMEVEQLIQNFDEFAARVQEVSIKDLQKMGLTVVSFTIKEIKDSVGYLEALGRKRTADVKRDADIGVAKATMETQIAQAQSQRDSQIAQAQAAEEGAKAKLLADTRVAEATKNFQVNNAHYLAEVSQQKAVSDMTYDIVKAQTQQKLIEETQKIRIIEATKEVELQAVEVKKREVQLEWEVTKPTEAEQSKVRLLAQAEQDKRRLLAEGDAQAAKAAAGGQAEATKLRAQADAEATRAMGLAQAESQKAQGLANAAITAAQGQAEADAMSKKAEAFKQYGEAALASMIIERLPSIVGAAATPLSRIGSVTLLSTGEGGGTGASKLTSDVMNVAMQGVTMVKGLTGIDLTNYMKAKDTVADGKTIEQTTNS